MITHDVDDLFFCLEETIELASDGDFYVHLYEMIIIIHFILIVFVSFANEMLSLLGMGC